ncbi:MAG: universal stress protein [Chloroflexota bacterium]|nr:universal stress protein [Chloroflexota bacterium]
MGTILCATRGGEPSSGTEERAIALAKERGDTLLFLYIVNMHFLDKTAAPIVVDVEDELSDMGEFLLLMAKERAEQQGVSAEIIIRKGEVRDEIKQVAIDEGADLVVLGRPAGEESAFQLASLHAFAEEIEAETEAMAIIV